MTRVQSKGGELFLTITGKGHPTDSSEKRSLSSSPYECHVARLPAHPSQITRFVFLASVALDEKSF